MYTFVHVPGVCYVNYAQQLVYITYYTHNVYVSF